MKRKLVVLTGAGVSQESGIKTFRDSDGLWENYPVEEVASIDGWYRNKELMLRFYNERRAQLSTVEPNMAHKIIAELEEHFDVTVVTQNVDNLHERAGSSNIIHLHGELTKVRGVDDDFTTYDIGYEPIHLGDRSPSGAQLRPHIVWFGEAVPKLEDGAKAVSECDILLVVGTSLAVYPAASLVNYITNGRPIYLIDPKPIRINYSHYIQIEDVASSGMEKFRDIVLKKLPL
jgi:NAD-dependent deacetylase